VTADPKPRALHIEGLRHDFDRAFAREPAMVGPALDLLEIGVGGRPYALRIAEISGLFVDRIIAPLPTSVAGLLGITGIRGALLPVYDLRAMLEQATERSQQRWLAVAAGTFVGLAFERFEQHVRTTDAAIVRHDIDSPAMPHVREFVQIRERMTPIVSIASIVEAIRRRANGSGPSLEER
jgi:chemotaxis signal transduction protein